MKLEDVVAQDILNRIWGALVHIGLTDDASLGATAVMVRVLDELGFRAEALSVRLAIYNAAMARWIIANNFRDPTEDEVKALAKNDARVSLLGHGRAGERDPTHWPGHLVTCVWPRGAEPSAAAYIVDLAAPLAHKPKKGILVAWPLRVEMPVETMRRFVKGLGYSRGQRPDGSLVEYKCVAGDASYHNSPDWALQSGRYEEHVTEFTKAIRAFIKAGATPPEPRVEDAKEDKSPKV
jgi:hypothetical protein